jgi:hypothetical protein
MGVVVLMGVRVLMGFVRRGTAMGVFVMSSGQVMGAYTGDDTPSLVRAKIVVALLEFYLMNDNRLSWRFSSTNTPLHRTGTPEGIGRRQMTKY